VNLWVDANLIEPRNIPEGAIEFPGKDWAKIDRLNGGVVEQIRSV